MILRTALLAAVAVSMAAGQTPNRIKRTVTDAEVMSVHRAAILIDTHNDIPSRTVTGVDNHVVNVAGIDAVGLGSDFDGVACVPEDLNGVDKWPNLTRALARGRL